MVVFYFCPDAPLRSAGIRLLYRHVEILVRHGINASILHVDSGFQMPDVPSVPVHYLNVPNTVAQGDVVVVPEGYPGVMALLKGRPLRRFVIALSWDYVYTLMPSDCDWRSLGIERVLSNSPFIGEFISWSTRLPSTVFRWGIKPSLYFPQNNKQLEVVFIARKQERIEALQKILLARDPRYLSHVKWTALHDMSEAEYAAAIRRAFIFINLSSAEGLPCAILEAMRCNTLVAGYNSVGGQRELVGSGFKQNAILVDTLDYPTLATKLDPVLADMLNGDVRRYQPILQNALTTSAAYDWDSEESSIVGMWREFLA